MLHAPWTALSDDDLLDWRVCDLRLTLEATELQQHIAQLYAELSAKGITFHPPCYLADEWFCAEDVPAIALPFYLAHPRLRQLEETMVHEVEGDSPGECMKLLRHEAGHAIMYAYRLHRKRRFRGLFGASSEAYDEMYTPRPYCRDYVHHLENWYAQSHPDEDFAETFAVWLTPDSPWRTRYHGWGALKKLHYVDDVMGQIAGKPPVVQSAKRLCHVARLRRKLSTHYAQKCAVAGQEDPTHFTFGR